MIYKNENFHNKTKICKNEYVIGPTLVYKNKSTVKDTYELFSLEDDNGVKIGSILKKECMISSPVIVLSSEEYFELAIGMKEISIFQLGNLRVQYTDKQEIAMIKYFLNSDTALIPTWIVNGKRD